MGSRVLRAAPELLLGEGEAAAGQSCVRDPGNRTEGGTWICGGLCANQTWHKMQKKSQQFLNFLFFPFVCQPQLENFTCPGFCLRPSFLSFIGEREK